jgi:hypothetical protein
MEYRPSILQPSTIQTLVVGTEQKRISIPALEAASATLRA